MTNRNPTPSTDVQFVALIPSQGLGGGIEAYVEALLERVESEGGVVHRCVLADASRQGRPGVLAKVRFALAALATAGRGRPSRQVVLVFLPSFAVVGMLAKLVAGRKHSEVRIFFHGLEIWSANLFQRWLWRRGFRLTAVSSFSAGALADVGCAQVLEPGIPRRKYERLLELPVRGFDASTTIEILSVFRLPEAVMKGALVLLDAVQVLRSRGFDVRLTIAGFGVAPVDLVDAVQNHASWAQVVPSPGDDGLMELYGRSSLFVLATRLRARPIPSGEGFGIVLAEAALAGRLVVAPAFGGSASAFLSGITGVQPRDETVSALTDVLQWCIANPAKVRQMAENARVWASARFSPEGYAARVAHLLVDRPFEDGGDVSLTPGLSARGGRVVD